MSTELNQSIWWGGLTESLCMTHVPIIFWKVKAIFTTTQKVGCVPINLKINLEENLVDEPRERKKWKNQSINIEMRTLWKTHMIGENVSINQS